MSLDWFTSKNNQGFTGSSIRGHIGKTWKLMVKIFGGRKELTYSTKAFLTIPNWKFTARTLDLCMTFGIVLHKIFLLWEEAKGKFNLDKSEEEVWVDITCKIADQWCNLLEFEEDTAIPGHWLGLYIQGEEDSAFVIRCDKDFTPACLQRYKLTIPIPTQCYTVGTHSRCLRTCDRPNGEVEEIFYMVKVIHTNRGPKKEGEQDEIIFFYGKLAFLRWDPDRWRWMDGGRFLNFTTKDGREFITNNNPGSTRAGDK